MAPLGHDQKLVCTRIMDNTADTWSRNQDHHFQHNTTCWVSLSFFQWVPMHWNCNLCSEKPTLSLNINEFALRSYRVNKHQLMSCYDKKFPL